MNEPPNPTRVPSISLKKDIESLIIDCKTIVCQTVFNPCSNDKKKWAILLGAAKDEKWIMDDRKEGRSSYHAR